MEKASEKDKRMSRVLLAIIIALVGLLVGGAVFVGVITFHYLTPPKERIIYQNILPDVSPNSQSRPSPLDNLVFEHKPRNNKEYQLKIKDDFSQESLINPFDFNTPLNVPDARTPELPPVPSLPQRKSIIKKGLEFQKFPKDNTPDTSDKDKTPLEVKRPKQEVKRPKQRDVVISPSDSGLKVEPRGQVNSNNLIDKASADSGNKTLRGGVSSARKTVCSVAGFAVESITSRFVKNKYGRKAIGAAVEEGCNKAGEWVEDNFDKIVKWVKDNVDLKVDPETLKHFIPK